ncbi:hypothetical protein G4B88_017704 [Cannabis sativa]|uniref:SRR1-like domain-containing protein n=1 Tax=Cannabis sativa TaxID=3483 RepID=A0A7J6I3M9_CANSA|nr:hypothetical protein G4B88_017704 [Cannabis sativa]
MGSQRGSRTGTTQDALPVSNWKKWSNFVPLLVALVVMSEITYSGRLDVAKNVAKLGVLISQASPAHQETPTTIKSLVQQNKNKPEIMPFFVKFLDQIIQTPDIKLRFENLVNATNGSKIDMVIYCIGSIKNRELSRLQLSLALLLKEELDWIFNGNIEIFDPILTAEENEVLSDMGFKVLRENEEGGRKVNKPTVFFMPRCDCPLYVNLAKENQEATLENVVIFGSSFRKWKVDLIPLKEKFKGRASPLVDGVDFLAENFSNEFEVDSTSLTSSTALAAFSELSWHFSSV